MGFTLEGGVFLRPKAGLLELKSKMKTRRLSAGRHDVGAVVAPYFSLARAAWVPCVVIWDPATAEFRRVEGPRGFATRRAAGDRDQRSPLKRLRRAGFPGPGSGTGGSGRCSRRRCGSWRRACHD
jgi:hypothetical protein